MYVKMVTKPQSTSSEINSYTIHQNPHYIPQIYLTLPLSNRSTTLITTPPFCHERQRVNNCEVVISSSWEEPKATSSLSSPLAKGVFEDPCSRKGANPPSLDWRRAMQPILVFIWHISSIRRSRRSPFKAWVSLISPRSPRIIWS